MRLLEDCQQFADRHRGQYKTSGPHWSLIIRFVKLYDYACSLETENKRLRGLIKAAVDIWFDPNVHGDCEELSAMTALRDALKGGEG